MTSPLNTPRLPYDRSNHGERAVASAAREPTPAFLSSNDAMDKDDSVSNDAMNKDDSVATIDRELAKYHALIKDLNRRRNRLVPIFGLPPEVLCTIFFFASRLGDLGIEWIQLTHVCQYWRDLALKSPTLWTNPPLRYNRWTEVMLDRSKTASLTLQADYNLVHDHNALQNLFNIIQNSNARIKRIFLPLAYDPMIVLEKLPSSAPNLESLVIITSQNPGYRLSDNSLCDMGRLQEMELAGLRLNWDLHLPSTLINLKIHGPRPSSISEMDKIMGALERMPLLRTLELTDALPDMKTPLLSPRDIRLPKLQTLKLDAGVAEAECLLRSLTFPSNTSVQILCEQTAPTNYFSMSRIFSSLARSQKEGGKIKVLKATLNTMILPWFSRPPPKASWHIQAFTSVKRPSHTISQPTPSMDCRAVWFIQESIKSGKVLRELAQTLSLDNVRNLSLLVSGATGTLSVRTILDTVGSLPRVRTFTAKLEPNIVRALKSHLQRVPGHSEKPSKISFPSLRNLVLKDGEFIEEIAYEPGDVTVEMLLDCLTWRSECGTPVEWLNVEECKGVDGVEVDRLEEVVEEVVWDPDFEADDEDEAEDTDDAKDEDTDDEDEDTDDEDEDTDDEDAEREMYQDVEPKIDDLVSFTLTQRIPM